MANAEAREQVAHVFRRCGFGPLPGQVEAWADAGASALIDDLLAREDDGVLPADDLFRWFPGPHGDDGDDDFMLAALDWMTRRMVESSSPLHERMAWFWHGHLTSSVERSTAELMWRQHHMLRRHALGHFPTLLREATTDAAMLLYLDGAESIGAMPNENHARELLELFALGRNAGYGEDDVRAAARIMAGWWVDWETGEVHFEPEYAYTKPVTFMGERRRWTLDGFIEFVCAQPACARHVTDRLWRHLVGTELDPERHDELSSIFRSVGLEIRPLVSEILRGPEFLAAIRSRARQPLEWLVGARQAIGAEDALDPEATWWFELLGQAPWWPPNVAGWPLDDRWAGASQIIARTAVVLDWELPERLWDEVDPTADAVLRRCGIHDPSEATRDALAAIEDEVDEYDGRLELLFATTLVSPEFSLL